MALLNLIRPAPHCLSFRGQALSRSRSLVPEFSLWLTDLPDGDPPAHWLGLISEDQTYNEWEELPCSAHENVARLLIIGHWHEQSGRNIQIERQREVYFRYSKLIFPQCSSRNSCVVPVKMDAASSASKETPRVFLKERWRGFAHEFTHMHSDS